MEKLTGITSGEGFRVLDQRDPNNIKSILWSELNKGDLIDYLWYLKIEPPNKHITKIIDYNQDRDFNSISDYNTVKAIIRRDLGCLGGYDVENFTTDEIRYIYAWDRYSLDQLRDYLKQAFQDLKLLDVPEISSLSLDEIKSPELVVKFPSIRYRVNPLTIDSNLIHVAFEGDPTITELDLELYGSEFQWIIDQHIPADINPEQAFIILNYFGALGLRQQFFQDLRVKIYHGVKQALFKEREQFYERHIDKVNWSYLSENPVISEAFIERHADKINWARLSKNTSLSEAFVERHLTKGWNYTGLSENPAFSEDFVERHFNDISWKYSYLSENPSISEKFFEQHPYIIDWMYLSENIALSEDFIGKHLDMVSWDALSGNPALSDNFIEILIRLESDEDRGDDELSWTRMSKNPALSEDFFERHLDEVDWTELSMNLGLSEAFVERHLDMFDWKNLSANPALSEAFLERHLDKVSWRNLFRNPALSDEFAERYFDKINWYDLVLNPSISTKFFEKHQAYLNVDTWMYIFGTGISERLIWRTIHDQKHYSFDKLIWQK